MIPVLYTDHKLVQRIGDIGMLRKPGEAAGFIFPDNHIIELANRSLEPTSRFMFDPEDVRIALEINHIQVTDEDWEDVIFWHTHPGGYIGPSAIDLNNKLGDITHLVVALTATGYIPTLY